MQSYLKKQETSQINNLNLHTKSDKTPLTVLLQPVRPPLPITVCILLTAFAQWTDSLLDKAGQGRRETECASPHTWHLALSPAPGRSWLTSAELSGWTAHRADEPGRWCVCVAGRLVGSFPHQQCCIQFCNFGNLSLFLCKFTSKTERYILN